MDRPNRIVVTFLWPAPGKALAALALKRATQDHGTRHDTRHGAKHDTRLTTRNMRHDFTTRGESKAKSTSRTLRQRCRAKFLPTDPRTLQTRTLPLRVRVHFAWIEQIDVSFTNVNFELEPPANHIARQLQPDGPPATCPTLVRPGQQQTKEQTTFSEQQHAVTAGHCLIHNWALEPRGGTIWSTRRAANFGQHVPTQHHPLLVVPNDAKLDLAAGLLILALFAHAMYPSARMHQHDNLLLKRCLRNGMTHAGNATRQILQDAQTANTALLFISVLARLRFSLHALGPTL